MTVAYLRPSYSDLAPDVSLRTHLPVARAVADARRYIPSRSVDSTFSLSFLRVFL